MGASPKDGSLPKSITEKLTIEEMEAFTMWTYKQIGIMPNQYHHTYEEGSTIIYPEHIRDLIVVDKMVSNKFKFDTEKQRKEEEQKQRHKGLGNNKGSNRIIKGSGSFYGNTIKFD